MSARRRILMPLPDVDFDVTEVAVPWRLLTRAGHEVVFATEHGERPAADPRLLTGVIFGQLGADPEPRAFYRELERTPGFDRPILWEAIDPEAFDGLYLAGVHAPGMRQYLAPRRSSARWPRSGSSRAPSPRSATASSFSRAPATRPRARA